MAAKYPSDLDRLEDVFQDEIIDKFSRIVSFKSFARSKNGLCLDESVIQTVIDDNPDSVVEQKMQILLRWKEKSGTEATPSKIRSIVERFKDSDSAKDEVRVSADCTIQLNDPISRRSRVYRGLQQLAFDTRQVAVKLAPLDKRNRREAEHLSKLDNHPNVVRLIQSGIYKESPMSSHVYMVMERCRSDNLENMTQTMKESGKSPSDSQKLAMSKQFLQGLAFIHSNDIIHRDIKPTNVLISKCGKYIKICDYGLSKSLSQGRSATNISLVRVGTDGFRAPETYWRDVITKESDVYSSSLLVHFITSEGKHPFGKDPDLWNSNIKNNKNCKFSLILTSGKKSMEKLLRHMMEFEPKKRPSAVEVLASSVFIEVSTDLQLDLGCAIEQANAIVIYDFFESRFISFDPEKNLLTKMHLPKIPNNAGSFCTFLVVNDHIHAIRWNTMHHIKYSKPDAVWVELQTTNVDHGWALQAVVLNDSIYICGGSYPIATRLVEKYKAGQWHATTPLNVERSGACVVAVQDFIYCMGGFDGRYNKRRSVEIFDEITEQWCEIESMPRATVGATAVEKDGIISVADEGGIQCFNIQKRVWAEIISFNRSTFSLDSDHVRINLANIHVVNNQLYVVLNYFPHSKVRIYQLDQITRKLTLVHSKDIDMGLSNSFALKL